MLSDYVEEGEQVVFLSQGDVSFFSTSSYLLLELRKNHPEYKFQLIPGITSFSAAAAEGCWPLALQKDQLLVMPTPDEIDELKDLLQEAASLGRVICLLKLGHRWIWVRPLLEKMNLLKGALFAERVGWPDQQVVPASQISASSRPYFSLLLIRQIWPEVIP